MLAGAARRVDATQLTVERPRLIAATHLNQDADLRSAALGELAPHGRDVAVAASERTLSSPQSGDRALYVVLPHGGARSVLRLATPVRVGGAEGYVEVTPAPAFSAAVHVDFPGLGPLTADDPAACADARTFGFLRDAERLRAQGLARGASLANTVVFDDAGRCLNPGGLRGPDEPARHKLLDLLGDLALLGEWLQARVVAHRAGHALHHACVRAVRAATSSP